MSNRFIDELNDIFAVPLAVYFLLAGYFLCAIVFMALNDASDKFNYLTNKLLILIAQDGIDNTLIFLYSVYGVITLSLIFQPCLIASEIEYASKAFNYDIMRCNWTEVDVKLRKVMMIFMENMKKPIKLSAFGIFDINLETFLEVKFDFQIIFDLFFIF